MLLQKGGGEVLPLDQTDTVCRQHTGNVQRVCMCPWRSCATDMSSLISDLCEAGYMGIRSHPHHVVKVHA